MAAPVSQTVLREIQLQEHHPQQQQTAKQRPRVSSSSRSTVPAQAASSQHPAFARLQARRIKRVEQRLTAVTPCNGAADRQPGDVQHEPAAAQPIRTRVRAKVTTTACSGMQREAPSRCSSTSCSVRGSLEMQQQQQLPLGLVSRGLQPNSSRSAVVHTSTATAAAFSTSSFADPALTVAGAGKQPRSLQTQHNCRALAQGSKFQSSGTVVGSVRTTLSTSTAAAGMHIPAGTMIGSCQHQHEHLPAAGTECWTACRSKGSSTLCKLGLRGAGGTRIQPQQRLAADRLEPSSTMGCGVPWQQLQAAASVAVQARGVAQPCSNLEQRRLAGQRR